jgi:hypothetical protein
MKNFFLLCFMQIILYGILCINYRAVAVADIPVAAITDGVIASLNFFVIKKISQSGESTLEWAGYTIGSIIGSIVGIWASTYFLGK